MLAAPLSITRQRRLFCLLAYRGVSYLFWCVCSFPILHGMHLEVPTHLSLFWVVSHPSRTLPPKEYEQEPQNRPSLLPTTKPYPLLPLTHDPPLLYWLGTSWRYLGFAHASLLCTSKACLLLTHWRLVCVFCHSSLTSYGVNCFMIFHSLWLTSLKG